MDDFSASAAGPTAAARLPISVSALVASARLTLEREVGLVHVTGEISGFMRAASGHCYFSLKDANAQVRCVLWRTKARLTEFALRDGLAVDIRAVATLYEPRGEFQLNVDSIRQAGAGALFERFAQLKARLDAAGWFDVARKRLLPAYPTAIGVVTSTRAAALRDVITTLARRWPSMRVIVYPTPVQGAAAAQEIAAAIATANAHGKVDLLIVCRGGGSIEDLWSFNEEIVARAILESRLPVVAGIGHETDFTIADFVADARAPTPTGAAMLVAPDRAEVGNRVEQWMMRILRATHHALAVRAQRADLAARGLMHPRARLAAQQQHLKALVARAGHAWRHDAGARASIVSTQGARLRRELRSPPPQAARVAQLRDRWRQGARLAVERLELRLDTLAQNLSHLAPQHVLTRGYAIVTRRNPDRTGDDIVQDARMLAHGDAVRLQFAIGRAGATVDDVEP